MGGGYGTLETSGESFSEVPPARTTTWKSISGCSCGGNGGDRRRGFWCSPDSPGGNSQWEFQQSLDRAGCSGARAGPGVGTRPENNHLGPLGSIQFGLTNQSSAVLM
jgi:hypothetical protein